MTIRPEHERDIARANELLRTIEDHYSGKKKSPGGADLLLGAAEQAIKILVLDLGGEIAPNAPTYEDFMKVLGDSARRTLLIKDGE